MKFWTDTKEKGEKVKHYIHDLAKGDTPVALSDVMEGFGHIPDPSTYNMIFDNEELLKKMRLRELKSGWFLYLPKPIATIEYNSEPIEPKCICSKEENNLTEVLDRLADAITSMADMNWIFPKCRYITKPKKNSIKEQKAYYIGTFQSTMPSDDGVLISQPLSIIVIVDGTVRQVKPTSLIFDMED